MRLPKHHYLGPGNSVQSGEPIDTDDAIAEIHDLAYEIQPEDVSAADTSAVDSFLTDFSNTGNPHSLLGGVGLQAKRTFEGIYGQQYPMHSHHGKNDYAYAIKRLGQIYQQHKKDNPTTTTNWREFQKLHFGGLMKEARGKRGYGQSAGAGGDQGNTKRSRDDAVAGPSGVSQRGNSRTGQAELTDSDWDDMLRTIDDNSGTTMGGTDVDSMETLANPSKGGGVSGHSHRGSGTNMIVTIPVTPKTEYYTKIYRKNWIFFSYGFTHTKYEFANNNFYTTPLALVPVDLLALYMDGAEFSCLNGRAVAVNANCRVRPLGCRMNFQTSATESKWATSEFVAIGQSGIGLNKQMPGENLKYVPNANNPMIVNTGEPIKTQDIHEKLYGDVDGRGMAQLVPRHLNIYFTPITATQTAGQQQRRFTHNQGPPKVDNYVQRYLINTCIGEPIVNYSYKIKNGLITDTYSADYINRETLFRTRSKATQVEVSPLTTDRNLLIEGVVTQNEQDTPNDINTWRSSFVAQLYQTLEHYDTYKWDSGHITANVQPQVHVGLTAVPAINPGSEATNFQNTAVYWSVECELVVHHYQNCVFHEGPLHTYKPYYYPPDYVKKYHSGNTYNNHPNLHTNQFQRDTREEISSIDIKTAHHYHDYIMENKVDDDESIEMLPPSSDIDVSDDKVSLFKKPRVSQESTPTITRKSKFT